MFRKGEGYDHRLKSTYTLTGDGHFQRSSLSFSFKTAKIKRKPFRIEMKKMSSKPTHPRVRLSVLFRLKQGKCTVWFRIDKMFQAKPVHPSSVMMVFSAGGGGGGGRFYPPMPVKFILTHQAS